MTTLPVEALECFQTLCEATVGHAQFILSHSGRKQSAGNLVALIRSAPSSTSEAECWEHRRGSFCRDCLSRAYEWVADEGGPDDEHRHRLAENHFLSVIPTLSAPMRKLLDDAICGVLLGLGAWEAAVSMEGPPL